MKTIGVLYTDETGFKKRGIIKNNRNVGQKVYFFGLHFSEFVIFGAFGALLVTAKGVSMLGVLVPIWFVIYAVRKYLGSDFFKKLFILRGRKKEYFPYPENLQTIEDYISE